MGGVSDGFITKISKNGNSILKSTFYGSNAYDQSYRIQKNKDGYIYIFGQTQATGNTFIYNATWATPNGGQFVSKLYPDLNALVWSTAFGKGTGVPDISPTAFLVDLCGYVYMSGWGGSLNGFGGTSGLPVTPNAFQSTTDNNDFYFLVISEDASSIVYGTYFGSAWSQDHVDGGTSRFDKTGKIYQSVCAGCGGDSQFPTTPGAWSNTNHSTNCNNALIKFYFELSSVMAVADVAPSDTGCVPYTVNFINNSNGMSNLWNFGDGSPLDTTMAPSHIYTIPGIYTVTFVAVDSTKCNISDTAWLTIHATPVPVKSLRNDTSVCQGVILSLDAGNPGMAYLWSTGATSQTINVSDTGLFWVGIQSGPCFLSDSVTISRLHKITYQVPNVFTPNNDGVNETFKVKTDCDCSFDGQVFNRWGKKIYHWTDISGGWDGEINNDPAADGVYYYVLHFENPCDAVNVHGFVTLIR
jgi:gliding motility-associated-like protein